ncbi:MAG: hypothetical protein ABIF92_00690 [archaeon]
MENRTLLMLAVLTSSIGLIILWFAAAGHEPPVIGLDEVTDELLGKVVTVNGTIESVKIYDTVIVAGFENSSLTLFGFKSSIPKIGQGDFVTVTGEIKEYEGALEIIPNKLDDVIIVKAAPVVPKAEKIEPNKLIGESEEMQHTANPQPTSEPVIMELNTVTYHLVGEIITVQGVLKKVNVFDSVVIGEFRGSDLKLFGFTNSIPKLEQGDFITVTGEIKEYKGELEIVPSKLEDVLIADRKN